MFLIIYAGNINNLEVEQDESLLLVMKNERDSVLISLTTPLWICQNTMKPHEDCVFCKCNQYYMTANETNGNTCETDKRSWRSARCIKASNIKEGMYVSPLQNKTTAKTIVACDHEFLQSYSECSYFEKEYIKRRNKKGHKLPVKCSVCNVFIVDKLE